MIILYVVIFLLTGCFIKNNKCKQNKIEKINKTSIITPIIHNKILRYKQFSVKKLQILNQLKKYKYLNKLREIERLKQINEVNKENELKKTTEYEKLLYCKNVNFLKYIDKEGNWIKTSNNRWIISNKPITKSFNLILKIKLERANNHTLIKEISKEVANIAIEKYNLVNEQNIIVEKIRRKSIKFEY